MQFPAFIKGTEETTSTRGVADTYATGENNLFRLEKIVTSRLRFEYLIRRGTKKWYAASLIVPCKVQD